MIIKHWWRYVTKRSGTLGLECDRYKFFLRLSGLSMGIWNEKNVGNPPWRDSFPIKKGLLKWNGSDWDYIADDLQIEGMQQRKKAGDKNFAFWEPWMIPGAEFGLTVKTMTQRCQIDSINHWGSVHFHIVGNSATSLHLNFREFKLQLENPAGCWYAAKSRFEKSFGIALAYLVVSRSGSED